jgi:hypothetical protein
MDVTISVMLTHNNGSEDPLAEILTSARPRLGSRR